MDLEKFVRHFGFRVVRINEGRYKQIDSWSAYNAPNYSSYYKDHDTSIIEMEIDRRRLEYMANYFEQGQRLDELERDEAYLRRKYPGLQDAYDKYKMLLELYK